MRPTSQRMDKREFLSALPPTLVAEVGEGGTQITSHYPTPGEKGAEMVAAQAEGGRLG